VRSPSPPMPEVPPVTPSKRLLRSPSRPESEVATGASSLRRRWDRDSRHRQFHGVHSGGTTAYFELFSHELERSHAAVNRAQLPLAGRGRHGVDRTVDADARVEHQCPAHVAGADGDATTERADRDPPTVPAAAAIQPRHDVEARRQPVQQPMHQPDVTVFLVRVLPIRDAGEMIRAANSQESFRFAEALGAENLSSTLTQ
jgi:hypothetical protein